MKYIARVAAAAALSAVFCAASASAQESRWPHVVPSKDGTPISYEVAGAGEPALVFVHGWSCDARYWRNQLPHFSKTHRAVALDLAGHGHSGMTRQRYTMKAFGEDVQAVADAIGSRKLVLIGHSMGGPVIAEAARLMPGRVIGLIGIDTFDNIEYPLTRVELDGMIAPMKADFKTGSRQFVEPMISTHTDTRLRQWILSDIAAAPPAVAISALEEMMAQYLTGEAARIFERIKAPVLAVSADVWPINHAGNRRHMASFDAAVLKGADHFLMLDRPGEFNAALEAAVRKLERAKR
ncbi:MAG: alpha/beta hydrolase [Elusimicrobia bacterium]|nr:alpha/beta hydrolase [Elusimicrobiota bacterium]